MRKRTWLLVAVALLAAAGLGIGLGLTLSGGRHRTAPTAQETAPPTTPPVTTSPTTTPPPAPSPRGAQLAGLHVARVTPLSATVAWRTGSDTTALVAVGPPGSPPTLW